ncbi:hypothetical protein [Parasphingorhabdus sp.]|uniref:hypothetical protein n=1 Tax=Parasphingorhabdus sp. TaxID=2709688 RepID=UPI003A932EC3
MTMLTRISALAASTALIFAGVSPAIAAPIHPGMAPAPMIDKASLGWNADSDKAAGWRSYRGYRGHRRHRDRIDGGDILAGILVIGGIAAIASAASNSNRDRRYNDRDYRSKNSRYENQRYDDRRDDRGYDRGTGDMEAAINACSDAAERQAGRDARVSVVQSVARDGDGWRVEGELSNSDQRTFLCGATQGRVDFVQIGDGDLAFAN